MAMKLNLAVFDDDAWDRFCDAISSEDYSILIEKWLFTHYQAIEVTPPSDSGYEGCREFLFSDDERYVEFCLKWL